MKQEAKETLLWVGVILFLIALGLVFTHGFRDTQPNADPYGQNCGVANAQC